MFGVVHSATLAGTTGRAVVVEVHVSSGLPGFTIVGLPDAAVRESRDRVRAALLSSDLPWPMRRVTVNLAPSAVRKAGAGLDLAIALGVLVALDGVPSRQLEDVAFIGELGLDGTVRHVPGAIALVAAAEAGRLVVPASDQAEAAAARPGAVVGVGSLRQLVEILRGQRPWSGVVDAAGGPGVPAGRATPATGAATPAVGGGSPAAPGGIHPDLADVRGQRLGRRAVEVAAAGGHHLLMVGPPGSGKTMLARRLPGLLPPLSRDEALEASQVLSAAGLALPESGLVQDPPFRAPHHGASAVSIVGGGTWAMRPGEISMAHHGVLFLDEMGEFSAAVLDALRQPLEEGVVRVSRARGTVAFPASFLLVGAMNPCPCGEGLRRGACRCTPTARARYARRLSGPLLDRFDLVVPLGRPEVEELLGHEPGEPSAPVARRVGGAREMARTRGFGSNGALPSRLLERVAPLSAGAAALLDHHLRAGLLSGRGLDRVRRVARTLADLEQVAAGAAGAGGPGCVLEERHVAEALALRAGREVLEVGAA